MPAVDPYVDRVFVLVGEMVRGEIELDTYRTRVRQTLVELGDHSAAARDNFVEHFVASDHNVEVSDCNDCPFDSEAFGCQHPKRDNKTMRYVRELGARAAENLHPKWCPLRTRPTRVSIKEGA